MTEGAPRSAAARLPAILARRNPASGVALLEQLIRKGTVGHLDALSHLVPVIARQLKSNRVLVNAVVDLVTDVVARSSHIGRGDLAAQVAAYRKDNLEAAAATAVVEEMVERIRCEALPTTRADWLDALGVPRCETPKPEVRSEWGDLDLNDGRHLTRTQAIALMSDASELIEIRRRVVAGSTFPWAKVIDNLDFNPQELTHL